MDELSPLFQDIEFHVLFRGYDPDEVDAYVDRVAKAAALVQGRLTELQERVEAAETRSVGAPAGTDTEATLTRTLILAQRTADAAVAEAKEEAAFIVAGAESEAQAQLRSAQAEAASTIKTADDHASRVKAEAETDRRRLLAEAETMAAAAASSERDRLAAEVSELEQYRGFLQDDVEILERYLIEERAALAATVSALTDLVERPEAFRASVPPATSGIVRDEVPDDELLGVAHEAPTLPGDEPSATPDIDLTADDSAAAPLATAGIDVTETPIHPVDAGGGPIEAASYVVDDRVEVADPVSDAAVIAVPDIPNDDAAEAGLDSPGLFADTSVFGEVDDSLPAEEDDPAGEVGTAQESEPAVFIDDLATAGSADDDAVTEVSDQGEDPGAIATPAAAERDPGPLSGWDEPRFGGQEPATIDLTEPSATSDSGGSSSSSPPVSPTPSSPSPSVGDAGETTAGAVWSGPDALASGGETGTATAETPPLLVTAADLESGEGAAGVVEVDAGPATAPIPVIELPDQEASLFADPEPIAQADDPFLAQLREAVASDDDLSLGDDALSAFFDQDDDENGSSWFGRRR